MVNYFRVKVSVSHPDALTTLIVEATGPTDAGRRALRQGHFLPTDRAEVYSVQRLTEGEAGRMLQPWNPRFDYMA